MAQEQRRLAAILSADVAGYSRLMGRDESGTVTRLRELRTRRLEPSLARHGGRVVKLTGDGALIEFASAVDALSAAIEFQQDMTHANRDQAEDTAIAFRIGLHLGDVIVDGDDLYGDAVNVADRLEAQAPTGGIVVSGTVREAVAGRLKATFEDHGGLTLKNIERPIHAFGVNWDPADWPAPQTPASRAASPVVPASRKRRALWAAAALGIVILAVVGYRTFAPEPPASIAELKELKAEDLERLLAERRSADAAMAEKKRLEEEAKARAEAETATMRQAEAALKKAQGDRQQAEAELAKLKTDIAARQAGAVDQRELADSAARRAAAEEAQHKAEAETAALRRAEDAAQRKAAADAENKREADEALAIAKMEREKAEAEAKAKADTALASDFVVLPSNFSVSVTAQRFEDFIRSRSQAERGWTVLRHVDLATQTTPGQAEKFGVHSLPRAVIDVSNQFIFSLVMSQEPTFAMEGPIKVVVWQDYKEKVWLAYNSADWWQKIFARHGLKLSKPDLETLARFLDEAAAKATR
jgi:class 3 adenylate cyclase